jgi:PTH1 family peptidyl-tRNA hydrolase
MIHIVVGLGNPGQKYADTRHNVGRMIVESFQKKGDFSDWEDRKELKARMSKGVVGEEHVVLLEPDDYMNNSGKSVAKYVKDVNAETSVVIVQDDIDLPVGSFRISYNRGSGGHNGIRSVETELRTKAFTRVRVGIAPVTFFGAMRKPKGERAVQDFVLKKFTTGEFRKLETVSADASEAIGMIVQEGHTKAMNRYN